MSKEALIGKLTQAQKDLADMEEGLLLLNESNCKATIYILNSMIKSKKREIYGIKSQLNCTFPMVIEGFLAEDIEDLEQNERGTLLQQLDHYLGCPYLQDTCPNHLKGAVMYDQVADLTEIFKLNTGKYLRVTIEALEVGESDKCAECSDRFKCLTTRVNK